MAEINYETITPAYNDYMQRSQPQEVPTSADTGGENIDMLKPVKTGQAMENITLNTWIKSTNYQPRSQGFFIDGLTGQAQFSNIIVTGGTMSYNKLNFSDSINAGWYISPDGIYFGAAADTTKLKYTISTGTLAFVGTVSGRDSQDLADAIDNNANLITDVINQRFNTSSKQILDNFTFGASGALKMAIDNNNGLWISPGGILGKNSSVLGGVSFSIDNSGNATFIGTITASTITGGTVTGTLIQTDVHANTGVKMSASLEGIAIYGQAMRIYDTAGTLYGTIGGGGGYYNITVIGRNILLDCGVTNTVFITGAAIASTNGASCGLSSQYWSNVYTNNITLSSSYINTESGKITFHAETKALGSAYSTGDFIASGNLQALGGTVRVGSYYFQPHTYTFVNYVNFTGMSAPTTTVTFLST